MQAIDLEAKGSEGLDWPHGVAEDLPEEPEADAQLTRQMAIAGVGPLQRPEPVAGPPQVADRVGQPAALVSPEAGPHQAPGLVEFGRVRVLGMNVDDLRD
jgi:hypothetical protein